MTRYPAAATLLATLLVAGTAVAQTPHPPGSLSVMSRPSGASFRLVGVQMITARTPIVIERGLAGRYKLECLEPGYNKWRRTLDLNGATADSVWMTLSAKSAAAAGARSLIFPGWGQGYSARTGACAFWMVTGLSAAGWFVYQDAIYRKRLEDLQNTQDALNASSNPGTIKAQQNAEDRYHDARQWRSVAGGTAATIWGLNFLDAIVHFPAVRAGQISASLAPVPAGPRAVAFLSAKF